MVHIDEYSPIIIFKALRLRKARIRYDWTKVLHSIQRYDIKNLGCEEKLNCSHLSTARN